MQAECSSFSVQAFYDNILCLVQKSCAMLAPTLFSYHRNYGDGEMPCFQMLGFDVILDEGFVPYLLEINNSPSLCIDEAFALDAGAAGLELGESPGRPKTREKGKVCRCMDMVQ